jgi:hypothetical protein
MATDSLQIFNKSLADKLLEKDADEFEILDACFSDDEIYLDYYGCLAYLNGFEWENTISSLKIIPYCEEETFILLQPSHVDKITKSLQKHINELSVMTEEEIDKIIEFKNYCDRNEDFMVAYMIDF